MSDARIRELERRFLESGSYAAELAWLGARYQAGELGPEALELAAYLGAEAAREILGPRAAPVLPDETAAGLVLGLKPYGRPVWAAAGAALASLVEAEPRRTRTALGEHHLTGARLAELRAPEALGPLVRAARLLATDVGLGDERVCRWLQDALIPHALGQAARSCTIGAHPRRPQAPSSAPAPPREPPLFSRVEDLVAALAEFAPGPADDDTQLQLYRFLEGAAEFSGREALIPAAFDLFERCPEADFGNPGPLVRLLEEVGGYEDELLRSLERAPTLDAATLVLRLLNLPELPPRARARWVRALDRASEHPACADSVRERVLEILHYHR